MNSLAPTLSDFGRSLQLDRLEFGAAGVAAIEIEGLGLLHIEQHECGLVMLLRRSLSFVDSGILEKALKQCDPRDGLPFQPQAALYGASELVFGFVLPESEVTVPSLTRALHELELLHERVAG